MKVATPHLSHSRISKYLTCPEQYRLYYVENLRQRYLSSNLVFGQIVHQALAQLFQAGEDPVGHFLENWTGVKDAELSYGKRDSWESLRGIGEALLTKFVDEELPKFGDVESSEKPFELEITTLDLPFVGIIDLVADVQGQRTVVDFKTSASSYRSHEARMSDQLTAYRLAEPDCERAALCVLVKTKTPKIEWHFAGRTSEQIIEYLAKTQLVAQEITDGRFYKRPGMWCTWCDYLPVCLGDEKKIKETLVQL